MTEQPTIEEAKKVYGIWYADYSNSSVGSGVYSSRDDAAAVARESGGEIEEFEVDPPLSEGARKLRRPGECFYSVAMDCDGNQGQAWPEYPKTLEPKEPMHVRVDKEEQVGVRLSTACWATDEKHAIKIVNERRLQWLARGGRFNRRPVRGEGGTPNYDYGWRNVI